MRLPLTPVQEPPERSLAPVPTDIGSTPRRLPPSLRAVPFLGLLLRRRPRPRSREMLRRSVRIDGFAAVYHRHSLEIIHVALVGQDILQHVIPPLDRAADPAYCDLFFFFFSSSFFFRAVQRQFGLLFDHGLELRDLASNDGCDFREGEAIGEDDGE